MKTTGTIPPMESLADLIADQHNSASVLRLIRAFEKRVTAGERQDRPEACVQAHAVARLDSPT